MKILLATDGSPCSTRAARYLAKHLDLFGVGPEILLLNADPPLMKRVAIELGPEDTAQYHLSNSEWAVKSARRVLTLAQIPFREILLIGEPGETIAKTAKNQRCDLIVMGSRGRGTIKALFLGSIVSKVLAQSTVPVLVVR